MLVRVQTTELLVPGLSCVLAGLFIGIAFDSVGSSYRLLIVLVGAAASLLSAVLFVRDAHSKASRDAHQ